MPFKMPLLEANYGVTEDDNCDLRWPRVKSCHQTVNLSHICSCLTEPAVCGLLAFTLLPVVLDAHEEDCWISEQSEAIKPSLCVPFIRHSMGSKTSQITTLYSLCTSHGWLSVVDDEWKYFKIKCSSFVYKIDKGVFTTNLRLAFMSSMVPLSLPLFLYFFQSLICR